MEALGDKPWTIVTSAARPLALHRLKLAGLPVPDLMITAEDVAALASELMDPSRLSAAGVGGDEDVFRRALEPVSDSLALAA